VTSGDPLVEQVLSGESFELRVLAAQGILPLPLGELVALQIVLAGAEDSFIAESARSALLALDRRVAASFLGSEASHEVLYWFARHHDDPALVEAILRRRDVPSELLLEVAPRLSGDLQEVLLLRQDAIVQTPEILDSLEMNPRLSPFSRRRIGEFREHLLPRKSESEAAVTPEDLFQSEAELTSDDLAEIERVLEATGGSAVVRQTGLSEHQVRSLSIPLRLKLARGASRGLRNILIRDANTNVALATLANSAFAEDEIELLASSRVVVDDVLMAITRKREWVSRYSVCLNLVKNPRMPVATALKLVARLAVRDLRNLARDRNVADAVRSAAYRLYRIKTR
jgi:hypothetical protein